MAPPQNDGVSSKRPISTVLLIIAMQTEALPIINKFQLSVAVDSVFPEQVPWVRYHGTYKSLYINIVLPGKDVVLGVDNVGKVSASLVTYASIQALKPDLIINAGTAGGFKEKGAGIGDVFLVSDVGFHDRRIPVPAKKTFTEVFFGTIFIGFPAQDLLVFDLYGVGLRQALSTPNILKHIKLKGGKLSTGDSMDMCPQDESAIIANDASLKDMEGAAIAYVADLFKVPAIFMKAVTDIVDGEKPNSEEYVQNLSAVTSALGEAVSQVIHFINGKCISEL